MMQNIGFIGSGNVATQLAKAFWSAGINISFVYSRTLTNAQTLADQVDASVLKNLEDLPTVDAVLLCVNDDAIEGLSRQLPENCFAIHTSGASNLDLLQVKHRGVLYPFQSINKQRTTHWESVPFLLEASSTERLQQLKHLASTIGSNIQEANSEQRLFLHLTGVLVNNFTNHLAALSFELLKDHKLSPELLYSLVQETSQKILTGKPREQQTGPAIRGDQRSIDKHLEILNQYPAIREIYQSITKSIQAGE